MNVYDVENTQLEFLKDYKKEYNDIMTNLSYDYFPFKYKECYKFRGSNEPCGIYPITEFIRRDPLTYLKLKDSNKWYFNDRIGFYPIFPGQQPSPLLLEYLSDKSFMIVKYMGFQSDIIEYMYYQQVGNTIKIKWVHNRNMGTIFTFNAINWREFQWIQQRDPSITNFEWGGIDREG